MGLSEIYSKAGNKNITDTRLATIPLARARPISTPIGNVIKVKERSPATVVSELERISIVPLDRAAVNASLTLFVFALSSIKRCKRIIE